MRIFILEDDHQRLDWFRKRLVGHDVTYADSCSQFDRFQPPYDLILLDHDLGGRQLSDHEDNGEEFAKLIVTRIVTPAQAPEAVIVHSFNPEGALRIVQTMRALCHTTYQAPFGSLFFRDLLASLLQ